MGPITQHEKLERGIPRTLSRSQTGKASIRHTNRLAATASASSQSATTMTHEGVDDLSIVPFSCLSLQRDGVLQRRQLLLDEALELPIPLDARPYVVVKCPPELRECLFSRCLRTSRAHEPRICGRTAHERRGSCNGRFTIVRTTNTRAGSDHTRSRRCWGYEGGIRVS